MIITCPNCAARYKVKDGLITAKGKKVKCRKCASVFVAYPDKDAVLETAPPAGATTVIQESAGVGAEPKQAAPPKPAAPRPAAA